MESENYLLDSEVLVSQCECESLCCTSAKPFQPLDKSILIKLATQNRNFMASWYKTYPWLTVCMERKSVFCYYCRKVEKQGMLTFSKRGESTFTTVGYDNWKKALEKFQSHLVELTKRLF